MRFNAVRLLGLGATFALVAAVIAVAPAAAGTRDHHAAAVYVSPTGTAGASDDSCAHAGYSSIQAAIEAAPEGGTVFVCAGTYPGMVTVDRSLTLAGMHGATIDATGAAYGVGVSASYSTVTGLTVENASPLNPDNGQLADGIVTIGLGPHGPVAADHVTITHNVVSGNLGSGIDLNSTSYSVATGNVANGNGVGINIADDLGRPASHNTVSLNVANENFGGCGIALADHTGAGVTDNLISLNVANDNGLSTPTAPDASAGSGVILASPIPGGVVTGNTITLNRFSGNGHAGVVVHAHAPGANFGGNVISHNWIGTNNVRTDENDLQTTGIYLGSFSPQSITVSGNVIFHNYYGIFTSGPVTVTGGGNIFIAVTAQFGSAPTF
ncbi:MAG TPA: right-handed parallel beta-helix repeat-containing protein [Gaiellaceae bacterium]|nr:right-handed parallel beta-helix repeat-containing protein [Gaiellaceae bacterium]